MALHPVTPAGLAGPGCAGRRRLAARITAASRGVSGGSFTFALTTQQTGGDWFLSRSPLCDRCPSLEGQRQLFLRLRTGSASYSMCGDSRPRRRGERPGWALRAWLAAQGFPSPWSLLCQPLSSCGDVSSRASLLYLEQDPSSPLGPQGSAHGTPPSFANLSLPVHSAPVPLAPVGH